VPHDALQTALDAFAETLDPELAQAFAALRARREAGSGDPHSPLGHPVLQLAGWTAQATGLDEPETVDALSLGAAFGYLHVSVQDALIDDGLGEPAATMLLSDRLRARHEALVRGAVGADPRYWTEHEGVWARYGAAMLLERRLHAADQTLTAVEHSQILDRSMPLVLPGLAVLARAGRWDQSALLADFVRQVVTAGQLWDDLVDLEVDRAAGRHTWLVRRLGGLGGREALVRGLMVEGGLDTAVDEALAHLDQASAIAETLGLPADAFLAARRAGLLSWQQGLWASLLQILGGRTPAPEVGCPQEVDHGRP